DLELKPHLGARDGRLLSYVFEDEGCSLGREMDCRGTLERECARPRVNVAHGPPLELPRSLLPEEDSLAALQVQDLHIASFSSLITVRQVRADDPNELGLDRGELRQVIADLG